MPAAPASSIWAGAIGDVHEVHIWTNRPLWPQGMVRPEGEDPVPSTFDWDLWLGPSPARPFKDKWPAGHLAWEQITAPDCATAAIRTRATGQERYTIRGTFADGGISVPGLWRYGLPLHQRPLSCLEAHLAHAHPRHGHASIRGKRASGIDRDLRFSGAQGLRPGASGLVRRRPPAAVSARDGGEKTTEDGVLYIGTKGKMLRSKILTPDRAKKFANLPKKLPRRPGVYGEWMIACKGGEPAGCNFDWAGPLTDFVLLGEHRHPDGRHPGLGRDIGPVQQR